MTITKNVFSNRSLTVAQSKKFESKGKKRQRTQFYQCKYTGLNEVQMALQKSLGSFKIKYTLTCLLIDNGRRKLVYMRAHATPQGYKCKYYRHATLRAKLTNTIHKCIDTVQVYLILYSISLLLVFVKYTRANSIIKQTLKY